MRIAHTAWVNIANNYTLVVFCKKVPVYMFVTLSILDRFQYFFFALAEHEKEKFTYIYLLTYLLFLFHNYVI